jgi:hypothetical protein
MPLQNWIMFTPGKPERMHFSDHHMERREITDPGTGRGSYRNVAIFEVDQLNGQPVGAQLSVIAEKLFSQMEPYLDGKKYLDYDFTITKSGAGYTTSYSVQVTPRQ